MNVQDTKLLEKRCSRCDTIKIVDKFIKKRNICKDCSNKRSRELYSKIDLVESEENIIVEKICGKCNQSKSGSCFIKTTNICCDCNNKKRRERYMTDENFRLEKSKKASEYKHNKVIERRLLKLQEIGEDNKKCSCCYEIKNKSRFRYNRLKCRDCERDDPMEKFKRKVRCRIYCSLIKKDKHTIEYLGTTSEEYLQWLLFNNDDYMNETENKWHIDHVIPLSKFDLENEEEQLIAFNWRNTTVLSSKENLSKNNKIIKSQIEQHWIKLLEYHTKYNIIIPQRFIDLYAT